MKRFFDTEMVLRPWFRALNPRLKCLWLFMVSRCDMAGVIDMDWGLASFAIGQDVTPDDMPAMNGNAVSIGKNKIMLPGFIPFQYGELNDKSPVHKGVFKVLESHGLEYPFKSQDGNRLLIGYQNPIDSTKDKDKDKDKTTANDTEGGCKGETKPPKPKPEIAQPCFESPAFLQAWQDWQEHRREIKKPLTPRASQEQMKEFRAWGEVRAIKAIRHTIKKQWVGIREEDAQPNANKPQVYTCT